MPAVRAGMTNRAFSSSAGERKLMYHFVAFIVCRDRCSASKVNQLDIQTIFLEISVSFAIQAGNCSSLMAL
jgi:hypothetical protein